MGEILFLAHRIPFPPDRGDKIRSHHILKRLAEIAPVHVATLADDDADMEHEQALADLAQSYRLVRRSKPLALAGLQALATSEPVSLTAFHDRVLAKYVADTVASHPISTIYVFSGQMGQYVPASFNGRVIADFVDVDSAKFEAYAERKDGLRAWIDAREAKKLRAVEAGLAERAAISLLISDEEAALFRSRLPERLRKTVSVQTLPNGIDSAEFDPDAVEPEPRMTAIDGPRLIFTGQMDYAPNIDAALRVMDRILPDVRRDFPHATFHVVGRNPPDSLLARHGRDGCYVWGRVPDMRTWLKAADLAIVPLDIGRGVQNKVLEAMSMALPVVLTPEAATGIGARNGADFRIGQSDEELTGAILDLAGNTDSARATGNAARRFIVETASWEAALAGLPGIMGPGGRSARDAA